MIDADNWDALADHMGHRATVTRTVDGMQVICVDCGAKIVQVTDVRDTVTRCLKTASGPNVPDAMKELVRETACDTATDVMRLSLRQKLAWLARRTDVERWLHDLTTVQKLKT